MSAGCHRKWPAASFATRAKLGLAVDVHPWTHPSDGPVPQLKGVPACTGRVADVINCCYWKLRKAAPRNSVAEVVAEKYVNISQSVDRLPACGPSITCFTKNAHIYAFDVDATLSGLAHLQAIGHPASMAPLGVISDSEARNIAGDSFSVPLACIVGGACALNPHAPWNSDR